MTSRRHTNRSSALRPRLADVGMLDVVTPFGEGPESGLVSEVTVGLAM